MEVRPQRLSRAIVALTVLFLGLGALFYFWLVSRSDDRVPRRARLVELVPAARGEYSDALVTDYLGRLPDA